MLSVESSQLLLLPWIDMRHLFPYQGCLVINKEAVCIQMITSIELELSHIVESYGSVHFERLR